MITQRQIGKHALLCRCATLCNAETPDVVVVGGFEIETITQALSAAETGVLVLGTLHSNTAAKAVDRLLNVPKNPRAGAQRACGSSGASSRRTLVRRHREGEWQPWAFVQTFAVSNMIREGKIHQIDAYMDTQSKENPDIQTMDRCLNLVRGGVIDAEEGVKFMKTPINFG